MNLKYCPTSIVEDKGDGDANGDNWHAVTWKQAVDAFPSAKQRKFNLNKRAIQKGMRLLINIFGR